MSSDPTLNIVLCSREHEKIQLAAMMASVAAVCERPVRLFVSMNSLMVFDRKSNTRDRYQGGFFSKLFKQKGAPDPIELLMQGKEFGDMEVYACSMALDIAEWDEERLIPDLFEGVVGLTKFLDDAKSGQLITI